MSQKVVSITTAQAPFTSLAQAIAQAQAAGLLPEGSTVPVNVTAAALGAGAGYPPPIEIAPDFLDGCPPWAGRD